MSDNNNDLDRLLQKEALLEKLIELEGKTEDEIRRGKIFILINKMLLKIEEEIDALDSESSGDSIDRTTEETTDIQK